MQISPRDFLEYSLAFLTIFVTVFFLVVFIRNRSRIRHEPAPPKNLPSITVLIPAFNEEKSIAKTIQSVLDADYPKNKLKIIVINDGSTDKTLSIARSFEKKGVLVLTKPNGGKATALNLGLKHAKSELLATLDSDSFMDRNGFKSMVGAFGDPEVAAVTSVLKVHEPRGFLEKFQNIEYLLIVFSRRLMSFINGINVTPGPLSIFRRSIFDEVGNYDEHNILEDQEMALRIQAHNYKIAASMSGTVHTVVPPTFMKLLKQRVRWQRGGIRNMLKHYYLINPKYGDFGLLIMPLGVLSVFILFLVFGLAIYSTLAGFVVFDFLKYGWASLLLGVTPLHVLSLFILLLSVLWILVGLREIDEEVSLFYLFLYVVAYAPVITLFWLVTLVKELTRAKLRW